MGSTELSYSDPVLAAWLSHPSETPGKSELLSVPSEHLPCSQQRPGECEHTKAALLTMTSTDCSHTFRINTDLHEQQGWGLQEA